MLRHVCMLGFAVLLTMCAAVTGCSDQAEEKLTQTLAQYKKSVSEKDYISQASFVLPSLIEKVGGVEGFVKLTKSALETMAQQGVAMSFEKMEYEEHSEIVLHKEYAVSCIPTKLPVNFNKKDGIIESSLIAFSRDKGETWFFIEGNDEGRAFIANTSPEILQKMSIPIPKLIIGNLVLIQKNGGWVKQ